MLVEVGPKVACVKKRPASAVDKAGVDDDPDEDDDDDDEEDELLFELLPPPQPATSNSSVTKNVNLNPECIDGAPTDAKRYQT